MQILVFNLKSKEETEVHNPCDTYLMEVQGKVSFCDVSLHLISSLPMVHGVMEQHSFYSERIFEFQKRKKASNWCRPEVSEPMCCHGVSMSYIG